jgi:hypothetical protein
MDARKLEEIATVRQQLRVCVVRLDAEARKRGFDPAQIENMALPTVLADLYLEREELTAKLAELLEHQQGDL